MTARLDRLALDDLPGVNLTPMIDIVFQLVTFFMLTLDLSSKESAALDLPRARQGRAETPAQVIAERRIVLNVLASGDVRLRGLTFPLSATAPDAQARALESLRLSIASIVRAHRRLPDGTSDVDVILRGDRGVAWRKVQWVLQLLGDPAIVAPRVSFAVDHPGGPDPSADAARSPVREVLTTPRR